MGRHKEFERNAVLERAMDVFWEKGYEAASVQELVERMQINRGSLYDTFGDKHSLFLTALDHYRDQQVSLRLKSLLKSDEGVEAIRGFFGDLVTTWCSDRGYQGCLMVNVMVELAIHDDEAAGKVAAHIAALEDAFYRTLLRAQKKGELQHQTDLRALARYLVNGANGLCVMAKVSPDRAVLEDIVAVTLSVLH